MIVLAIAVTAVCCYVLLKIFYKDSYGGIPGPMALPIIGKSLSSHILLVNTL